MKSFCVGLITIVLVGCGPLNADCGQTLNGNWLLEENDNQQVYARWGGLRPDIRFIITSRPSGIVTLTFQNGPDRYTFENLLAACTADTLKLTQQGRLILSARLTKKRLQFVAGNQSAEAFAGRWFVWYAGRLEP